MRFLPENDNEAEIYELISWDLPGWMRARSSASVRSASNRRSVSQSRCESSSCPRMTRASACRRAT